MLDRYFRITERGSSIRTELLGGATTFAAMAYIIAVNPAILQFAGLPTGPATVATIVTAMLGSLLMGLYANRPLAVAPYMGENAFLAFGLAAMGIGWQLRLGAVFIAGVVFVIITLLRLRSWLARSISPSLKHGFAVSIGLFLAFVGLYQSGLVTSFVEGMPVPAGPTIPKPGAPVKIGSMHDPRVLLAAGTVLLMSVLLCLKIRGAILIGMALSAAAGFLLGLGRAPDRVLDWPFIGEYSLAPIALQLDILGTLRISFLPVLLTLILMSFLDTLATLVGVGAAGQMLDKDGNFPEIEKPMMVDAVSCMAAATIGTSTSGAYIESATGVREGARTGLAAVATAGFFALSLFFIPLVQPLQEMGYVYGPALVVVGVIMFGSVARIDLEDPTEALPAFAAIVMTIFTYNMANGLTAGLILHPAMKLLTGRFRELSPGSVLLALMCLAYYAFGLPH